jgi:hypothetical protein
MSKDWTEEESTEETVDGEEPSSTSGGAGKRTVFTLGTLVALGLVLSLKGMRLYDRFFHASPQTAMAGVSAAVPSPVITSTRAPVATQPASRPATLSSVDAATAQVPVKTHPIPTPDLPTPTPSAPKPLVKETPAPAAPPAARPTPLAKSPAAPSVAPNPAASATPYPETRRLVQARATLEHLRARLQLYATQHAGNAPEFAKYPAWHQLTQRTRADGATDPRGPFGPYLDAAPVNPLNLFGVIGLTARTPHPGQTLRTEGKLGWVYCVTTRTLYATAADGKTILDEQKPATGR